MKFTYPSGSRPLRGYTIKRGIGIGGFGEVYFALSDAGKEVALKKIQRNLDVELRGVKQCLNIKHVNLISLWDIRTSAQNESWVVMEYVPGPSLRDILHRYPHGLPDAEIKLWMTSIASGVAHLHQRGIVHRDLKPGNIFRDDDAHVIKIGDYGLSKFISSRRSGQTETVGTVHYMAPEIGKGDYGKEIDVYALGIILFELITGDVPFDGESSQEIIAKHMMEVPKLDAIPKKFKAPIQRALSKCPEDRYRNVSSFVADLPWEDVANRSAQIAAFHAVGAFPNEGNEPEINGGTRNANEGEHDDHHSGAVINPILIAGSEVEVVRPDIIFGPLSERPSVANVDNLNSIEKPELFNRAIRKTTPPRNSNSPRDIGAADEGDPNEASTEKVQPEQRDQFSDANADSALTGEKDEVSRLPVKKRKLAKRTTVFGKKDLEQDPNDPIQVLASNTAIVAGGSAVSSNGPFSGYANRLSSLYERLELWWADASIPTPIKMFILLSIGAIVLMYQSLLFPLILILGLLYLVHFLLKTWLVDDKPAVNANKGSLSDSQIRAKKHRLECCAVREWIEVCPPMDRLTELVGSLFVSGLSCVLLGLFAKAVYNSIFNPHVESWATFVWIIVTSVVSCWSILAISKVWESKAGDSWFRRGLIGLLGVAVWLTSIVMANHFNVDLSRATNQFAGSNALSGIGLQIPVTVAYLIFFVGLFTILRWWFQTDPVRRTRLSMWSVGLSLLWAAVISQILGLPLIGNFIMTAMISISIQLASPWLNSKRREAINSTWVPGEKSIVS